MRKYFVTLTLLGCLCCTDQQISKPEGMEPGTFEKYKQPMAQQFFKSLMMENMVQAFRSKVMVLRGNIDCFYEMCKKNSELIATFQSVSPPTMKSSGTLLAYIRHPNSSMLLWTTKPEIESHLGLTCPDTGVYEYCLDNFIDRRNDKFVQVGLVIIQREEQYHREKHEEHNDTMYFFYNTLYEVTRDLIEVRHGVRREKAMDERDWTLMQSNHQMIRNVSCLTILLILLVSYGQVFFVKRFFKLNTRVTGSAKKYDPGSVLLAANIWEDVRKGS